VQDVQRQQLQQLALAQQQQQHPITSAIASAEARVALLASSMLELQRSGGGSFGGGAAISPRAQHTRAASAVASAMALVHNPAHHILVHNEHMQHQHHSPRGRSAGSSPIQMQLSSLRSPAVAPAPMAGAPVASSDEPAAAALRPSTRSRSFGPVEQQLQLQQRAAAIPGVATPLAAPSSGLWSAGTASPMPAPFASVASTSAATTAAVVVGTPIAGAATAGPTRLQFTPHIARAVSRAEKQVKQLQQQQQQQHPLQHGSISTRPHLR
jgi:hypothetical protein